MKMLSSEVGGADLNLSWFSRIVRREVVLRSNGVNGGQRDRI